MVVVELDDELELLVELEVDVEVLVEDEVDDEVDELVDVELDELEVVDEDVVLVANWVRSRFQVAVVPDVAV